MSIHDSTANTVIIPEIWSERFFEVNRQKNPFNDLVDMNYQNDLTDMGDIVNISTIADFDTANLLSEGAAGQTEVASITGQQLTVNKRPYKDYIVTKKAQLQSLPFMDRLREKAVFAIQKKIQAEIIAATIPSSSSPDHQISYDSGTTLALADILEAKELLMTQDVDQDEDLYCVAGAAQTVDLFNITGFTSRDFIPSGSPLTTGMIGNEGIVGFKPHTTTAVSSTSYFFHRSYLTLALQQQLNIEVVGMGAEGYRSTRVNVDILMAVKQLDDERVVSIS
jgi:hypothetical protein